MRNLISIKGISCLKYEKSRDTQTLELTISSPSSLQLCQMPSSSHESFNVNNYCLHFFARPTKFNDNRSDVNGGAFSKLFNNRETMRNFWDPFKLLRCRDIRE